MMRQQQQLMDLANYALLADLGNLDLKDETLGRAGQLTDADKQDVANARRSPRSEPARGIFFPSRSTRRCSPSRWNAPASTAR